MSLLILFVIFVFFGVILFFLYGFETIFETMFNKLLPLWLRILLSILALSGLIIFIIELFFSD